MDNNVKERSLNDISSYTKYVISKITEVCRKCGPRVVGSEGDLKAIEYYIRDSEEICDKTEKEEFKCSDKAFMSWVAIDSVLILSALIFFICSMPIVSLILTCIALFFIVSEFILYKQTLDIFFKKKKSANIIGTRCAAEETKKRIIFCGHTDSAFEWTYTYYGGRPAVMCIIICAVVDILLLIAGSVTAICLEGFWQPGNIFITADIAVIIFAIALIILSPIMAAAFIFCNFSRPVVGANDDLTGCYISFAVIKYMKDNDIRFKNTEVVAALVGGEESGLRGSKAYAKRHLQELKDPNVETVFIGLDTIHDFDFMQIIDHDLNGIVKCDKRAVKLIHDGARVAGYDNVSENPISLGATDSAALTEAGIPAASFTAMDPAPARYYHTRLDNENNLDEKTIEAGIKIALETAFLFDEKGLNY